MFTLAAYTGAYYVARVVDQGLANTVGLETLRHGTNPLSWLSIHLFGAMPSFGGSSIGGDYGMGLDRQNRGRFYFARDSDNYGSIRLAFKFKELEKRAIPKGYSYSSSKQLCMRVGLDAEIAMIISGYAAALLPTIKFRFSNEKIESFHPDNSSNFVRKACSTTEWQSPLNIGIVGTIWNSLTYKTFVHMWNNPSRVITGIAQLALCGLTTYAAVSAMPVFITAHTTAMVAGAILAVI